MTTPRLDPGQHTALPKALLELLIARHRLGHTYWTIETDRQTTAALATLARDGWIDVHNGRTPRTARVRITRPVWHAYQRRIDYTAPVLGGPD